MAGSCEESAIFRHVERSYVIDNKGYALVVVLFVSAIILALGAAVLNMSTNEYLMSCYARDYTMAYYLAEGGVQEALSILKDNPAYTPGTNWNTMGEGQYKVKISSKQGGDSILITSTGKVRKAEVVLNVNAKLYIEIDEEVYPDPPHRNVEIQILSWHCEGPI